MEIILLIAGGLIFILSFFIPDGKEPSGSRRALSEDEMNALLAKELTAIRSRVDDLVQEAVEEAMEKTERSLEKLSNEKIMAVNEYSDTVLAEIHKNHEEVLFLYDMLNNKHISVKDALGEINRTVQDAQKASDTLEKLMSGSETGNESHQEQTDTYGKYQSVSDNYITREIVHELISQDKEPDTAEKAAEEIRFTADGLAENQAADSQENNNGNNNVRILELYRQGKNVVDIARELSLGVGEVKLVVDLFKNQ